MSTFESDDYQGTQKIVSNQDVILEADRDQDGVGDLVFRTGGIERARIDHAGTGTGWANVIGGSLPSIDYRLASDGTTVTAYDKTGATIASGTDGGAVLTAVLPAANAVGATIEFRNDGNAFPWGSVPALPAGITGKLTIRGNGSVITLSAAGPRFLDLKRTADYVTFQHIEVADFVVNATASVAAQTHTIFGSRNGGTTPNQRINFLDIALKRIRCYGVPTTGTMRGVWFSIAQLAGGEGTQNTCKDILLEDVWVDGAQTGFQFDGLTAPFDGTVTNLNTLIDGVKVIRCKHTQSGQAVVGAVGTAACLQIGQNSPVGAVVVRDFYGEYSGDVCIEIDNAAKADIESSVASNCRTGYLTTNFCPPPNGNSQSVAYRRCRAQVTDAAVNTACRGWNIILNNAQTLGNIIYDECVYQQSNGVLSTSNNGCPFYTSAAVTVRSLSILNCKANIESINWNNAADSAVINGIAALGGSTFGLLRIQNFDLRVNGQISGAGFTLFRGIEVTNATALVRIDGYTVDFNVTGLGSAASRVYGAYFGATATTTLSGSLRGMHVVALGDTTASVAIRFGNTTNMTITNGPFMVEDCDFGAISGSTEIQADSTQTALGAILTRGNRWKTKPAPVALTGLATATGKTLGAAGATVFWSALVQLIQGSGSAITAVDYSTNGGTTYTNLLTQASAALPSGPGQNVGPLNPADLIKGTFTTTQPTITLVPINP